MKKIKHIILSFLAVLTLGSSITVAMPSETHAATRNPVTGCLGGSVLTFPCWYKGLALDSSNTPRVTKLNDIWLIALNVLEMFLQIIAYFATGYIIWGGFKYMKSQGNASNIASSKATLMNAVIGLGIAVSSVAIVNFIGASIRG